MRKKNKKAKRILKALIEVLDLNAKQVLGLQVAGGLLAIAAIIKTVSWFVSLNLHAVLTLAAIGIGCIIGLFVFCLTLEKVLDFDF